MKRTEELLALAEAAIEASENDDGLWYSGESLSMLSDEFIDEVDAPFISACDPETIKQMCLREQKLVESTIMLKDALSFIAKGCNRGDPASIIARDALEAFNKFERNL